MRAVTFGMVLIGAQTLAACTAPLAARLSPLPPSPPFSLQDALPTVRPPLMAGQPIADEQIVCAPQAADRCVCLAPFRCSAGSACTFDSELALIRRRLLFRQWEPFVHAEYGVCDDHYYIFMDRGETQGTILVFYAPDGQKIALARTSDYSEFCHRRSRHAFFGQVPRCRTMSRRGLISPNPQGRTPRSAIDSLLELIRSPGPASAPASRQAGSDADGRVARVDFSLDGDSRVIFSNQRLFLDCWDRAAPRGRRAARGHADVRLSIASTGVVQDAVVTDTLGDWSLTLCLERVGRAMPFAPAAAGRPRTVALRLLFGSVGDGR